MNMTAFRFFARFSLRKSASKRCGAFRVYGLRPRGLLVFDFELRIAEDASWVGEGQRLGAEGLVAFFERCPRFAVAFSGGCDSAYLLVAAVSYGCEVKAYLVRSAFQAAFEFEDALKVLRALKVPYELIDLDLLSDEELCANTEERCYLCKTRIFSTIREAALRDGYDLVVDGSNASDDPVRRPGFRALGELGVFSPLRRAGMSKAAVREASRKLEADLGLAKGSILSEKPSFPCLAVFVPSGSKISLDSLAEAERRRAGE